MTVDYSLALSNRLDGLRNVYLTVTATLCLLDYAIEPRKGYDILVIVPNGWYLSKGILKIVESQTVARELIDKTQAFGIYIPIISDPEIVWKMTGEDPRTAPDTFAKRAWEFNVIATQEPVNK